MIGNRRLDREAVIQDNDRISLWLYLVNAALLATHEIDSAYWHEWDLLRLPGGLQLFLVPNLLVLLVILYGLVRIARLERGTIAFSYGLAGAGIFAFALHMGFIWFGHPEFRTPVLIALLAASFCVSLVQIVMATRIRDVTFALGR